jgi:hypothetical protein
VPGFLIKKVAFMKVNGKIVGDGSCDKNSFNPGMGKVALKGSTVGFGFFLPIALKRCASPCRNTDLFKRRRKRAVFVRFSEKRLGSAPENAIRCFEDA